MLNHWISRRPQLVISITGSADGFDFNKSLEELLYSGLVKTALTTSSFLKDYDSELMDKIDFNFFFKYKDAWIITGKIN